MAEAGIIPFLCQLLVTAVSEIGNAGGGGGGGGGGGVGGAKDDAASQAQRAEALTLPTLRSIGNFLSLDSGGGGGGSGGGDGDGGADGAEEMVNVALAQDNFLNALVAVLESAGSWHRSYAKEAAWVACNIAATGAAHRAARLPDRSPPL